jgi:hypothetical protein
MTGTGAAQTITNGIDLDGEGGLGLDKDKKLQGLLLGILSSDTERGAGYILRSDQY